MNKVNLFDSKIRSAHGFSDTDMSTLLEQLQRESDDLCGHRGLTPGTKCLQQYKKIT